MDALLATATAAAITWSATATGAAVAAVSPIPSRRGMGVLLTSATILMGWAAVAGLGLPAWERAVEQVGTGMAIPTFLAALGLGAAGVTAVRRRLAGTGHGPVLGRQMYLVMTLHHLPEGMAVGLGVAAAARGDAAAAAAAGTLVLAMAVHNAAEGALVAAPLRAEGASRFTAFWRGQVSGLAEVAGALLGALAVTASAAALPWALAAAAGAMAMVIIGDLLPEVRASFAVDRPALVWPGE